MDGMTINHIVSIDHGSYEPRNFKAFHLWCPKVDRWGSGASWATQGRGLPDWSPKLVSDQREESEKSPSI